MTTFKHKSLPIEITYSEYVKLSPSEQSNFNIVNQSAPQTVVNNNSSDLLGLGKVAETVVVAPIAIVAGLFSLLD